MISPGLTTDFISLEGLTVPYPPFFGEGRTNRGFIDLRGRPDLAAEIAECERSPALKTLLVNIAEGQMQLFSLGCDLGTHEEKSEDGLTDFVAGGYIDIVSSDYDDWCEDDYRQLAEAIESAITPDAQGHRWEVYFGLKYCCMKLDGNGGQFLIPILDIGFFAASASLEATLGSREVLLVSLLGALRAAGVQAGRREDEAVA